MTLRRVSFTALALVVVVMASIPVQASKSWQQWEDLRWSGLEQLSKGDVSAARNAFEQALAEAKRLHPGGKNEVTSSYDLAQVYDAEGKIQQSEDCCERALELGRRVCPRSAMIPLILSSLVDLKRGEGKYDDAEILRAEMDKAMDKSPDAQTIGLAKMEEDGTVKLDLRGQAERVSGNDSFIYSPTDPDYKVTLMHVGPLRPGDQKLVAAWNEKRKQ
jgi:tetratricopeptide (TPR) repeat protein